MVPPVPLQGPSESFTVKTNKDRQAEEAHYGNFLLKEELDEWKMLRPAQNGTCSEFPLLFLTVNDSEGPWRDTGGTI